MGNMPPGMKGGGVEWGGGQKVEGGSSRVDEGKVHEYKGKGGRLKSI